MNTQHTGELSYLLHTKRLDPRLVTVVNEVAYWYDNKEVDNAIEHVKSGFANSAHRKNGETGEGIITQKIDDPVGGV